MTVLACEHETAGVVCGSTDHVDRFLPGLRCTRHSPAALNGRTVPDPAASAPAPSPPRPTPTYGSARTDPLGRTIPGTARNGMIPKRPEDTTP